MARPKKDQSKITIENTSRPTPKDTQKATFMERVQEDLNKNQSYLNVVLGILVILVLGVLLYNFFTGHGIFNNNQNNSNQALGSATQTVKATPKPTGDVAIGKLPGKYTVKSGDTLFLIAKKYYNDGYKFDKLASANNIKNVNSIEVGQVINIPDLNPSIASAATTAPSPTLTPSSALPSPTPVAPDKSPSTKTLVPTTTTATTTQWGPKITGNTYTVQKGDWLSKIAGRAYGDIFQYTKLAKANNISNPNVITEGTVLTIPR